MNTELGVALVLVAVLIIAATMSGCSDYAGVRIDQPDRYIESAVLLGDINGMDIIRFQDGNVTCYVIDGYKSAGISYLERD